MSVRDDLSDKEHDGLALLHVHGQAGWHDAVYVVGNREALSRLREQLNVLLDGDRDGETSSEQMTADGEGYELIVQLADRSFAESPDWALPYAQEYAQDTRTAITWPWDRQTPAS